MEVIETKNGWKFKIAPLTPHVVATADRSIGRGEGTAHTLDLASEVVRLLIASWTDAEGRDLLSGVKPGDARKLISSTPGLIDFVTTEAKKVADEAASVFKLDSGN